jgi:HEAT repeat protein
MRCPFCLIAVAALAFLNLSLGCNKKSAAPVADGGGRDGSKPSTDKKALDKLIADLKNSTVERRAEAVRGFEQLDADEAIPPLLEALGDKGFTKGAFYPGEANSTREAAVLALLKFGDGGVTALLEKGLPTLTAGLTDANEGVREHSALAIGLIGPKAKSAAEELLKRCSDADDNVRRATYDALQRLGGLKAQQLAKLLLKADKPKIIYDAARALNAIRPLPKEVVADLADFLKREPADTEATEEGLARFEVADALSSLGKDAEPAIPALMQVLRSTNEEDFDKLFRPRPGGDPSERRNDESPAMAALRKIGKPAVPALLEALRNPMALVRWQAAMTLAGIGPEAKEALPALQTALDEEFKRTEISPDVVGAAALAIVQLGGEATPAVAKVVELLKADSEQVRYGVVRLLARFGRKGATAVTTIIPLLDSPSEAIRAQTAETLRAFGPAAKAAVPALAKKLADEEIEVRRGAANTLKSLGPVAVEAVPDLVKLLGDEDEAIRREAIEALIAIGPSAKASVPELTKRLKAPGDKERLLAIEALGIMGTDAKTAAPELVGLLAEKDADIQVAAMTSLGLIGSATPEIVGALSGKLKSSYMRIRIAAVRALAMLGPAAKAAETDLLVFGGSKSKIPDPVAVVWSSVALYRLGIDADANLQKVVVAVKDKSPAGKAGRLAAMAAADLLGPGAKAVIPELAEALGDKTPVSNFDKTPVRQRAAAALGKMGPAAKDAVPKIVALLKENDPNLKRAALESLGQIGPTADFAAAKLREIIRTEPTYAEAAQEALDRIEKK